MFFGKLTTIRLSILAFLFLFFRIDVKWSDDYQINHGNQLSIHQNVCDVLPLLLIKNICRKQLFFIWKLLVFFCKKTQEYNVIFSLDYQMLLCSTKFSWLSYDQQGLKYDYGEVLSGKHCVKLHAVDRDISPAVIRMLNVCVLWYRNTWSLLCTIAFRWVSYLTCSSLNSVWNCMLLSEISHLQ